MAQSWSHIKKKGCTFTNNGNLNIQKFTIPVLYLVNSLLKRQIIINLSNVAIYICGLNALLWRSVTFTVTIELHNIVSFFLI